MGKKLVIVESPAKAKTINKYLGSDYIVEASMGHIRDLPNSRLGIQIDKKFEPEYEVIPGRKKTVSQLLKAAKTADSVYLAPDPDREGEAIAWHLSLALKLPEEKTFRVTFNEITRKAVQDAFTHPSKIDLAKVNAQQARRVVDRIVGYKISPLLWKKVARGLSAGRVQSVAVRLIVDREREIAAFKPEEYWSITARLSPGRDAQSAEPQSFSAELKKLDGRDVTLGKEGHIRNENQALLLVEELRKAVYAVRDIRQKRQKSHPYPPFTTSTLQQQASIRLGFTAQRTMRIAQQLYEGVDIGGEEGTVGLITYMRTDSVRISDEAVTSVRSLIGTSYGPDYLPGQPNFYKSKAGAQQAHEAIRPTDVNRKPEEVGVHLSSDQLRLYRLIWERFVASQMADAEFDVTEVDIEAGRGWFLARGRVMVFEGHLRVTNPAVKQEAAKKEKAAADEEGKEDSGSEPGEDQTIPVLAVNQVLELLGLDPSQHFTKPPPRYSEASLVKALEREGIGRPSTYAPIITTIQDRGYVTKVGRQFHATDLGILVTDKLVKHFPDILDVKFTSAMEENLDKIEDGVDWVQVTDEFYQVFKRDLDAAIKDMTSVQAELSQSTEVDVKCEKCGAKMVVRISRRGKFLGCSAFPKCRNTRPFGNAGGDALTATSPAPTAVDEKCEACGKPMVVRQARKGRSRGARFLSCSGYPACKTIKPFSTGIACGREGCQGVLVEKAARGRVFYGCSRYPECDFTANKLPSAPAATQEETGTGDAVPSNSVPADGPAG